MRRPWLCQCWTIQLEKNNPDHTKTIKLLQWPFLTSDPTADMWGDLRRAHTRRTKALTDLERFGNGFKSIYCICTRTHGSVILAKVGPFFFFFFYQILFFSFFWTLYRSFLIFMDFVLMDKIHFSNLKACLINRNHETQFNNNCF